YCTHPVRLTGRTTTADPDTGEIVGRYDTAGEPDGLLLKACGQRRATACPSCAATYRADAYQLIAAGLRGGKGIDAGVADHPAVFATFTAPSFGPVHSRRAKAGVARRCRPRKGSCRHGRRLGCDRVHDADDPAVGSPLCGDCFDYRGAVLWNAHATELWRRTTIAVRRRLAHGVGITTRAFERVAVVSYAKVVEYQRRGVIHLHVIVRLDPAVDHVPEGLDVMALMMGLRRAAVAVSVPYPTGYEGGACWGQQLDLQPITSDSLPVGAVAAYIAKYATKSTDAFGRLDHRLKADTLATLDVPDHLRRLVHAAWELGADPRLDHLRLRAWAHTLGFRGHWLTKSRHYSTTLGALRRARAQWAGNGATEGTATIKDWQYTGSGWANPGDALFASTAATHQADARTHARHLRREEENDGQAAAHP
ncbi:MAG: replication initiator, partial [Acidimicrobiales bacterium]